MTDDFPEGLSEQLSRARGKGDGKEVEALSKGNVMLKLNNGETGQLMNALYLPKLLCNLFSVGAAPEQDMTMATGTLVNRWYQFDHHTKQDAQVAETIN